MKGKRRCVLQNGKLEMFFFGGGERQLSTFFSQTPIVPSVFFISLRLFFLHGTKKRTYVRLATYKDIEALRMHFCFAPQTTPLLFPDKKIIFPPGRNGYPPRF